jgi:hypothetical protein
MWFSISISRICVMRSNEMTMPPRRGMHAPDSPVPLPRAVTGTPSSAASRTMPATSSVVVGRTTKSGRTQVAVSASSWA